MYQSSVATFCLQGTNKLAAQQLLQTIDKICMNVQASIVASPQSLRFFFLFFLIQCNAVRKVHDPVHGELLHFKSLY